MNKRYKLSLRLRHMLSERCWDCPICGTKYCNAGKKINELKRLSTISRTQPKQRYVAVLMSCNNDLLNFCVQSERDERFVYQIWGVSRDMNLKDDPHGLADKYFKRTRAKACSGRLIEEIEVMSKRKLRFINELWRDPDHWLGKIADEIPADIIGEPAFSSGMLKGAI